MLTGDGRRQRTGPGDELSTGQRGRKGGVRGHKRGGRKGNVGHYQRRPDRRGHREQLLHDQRGGHGRRERAGGRGRKEMGQGGRADQQRGYRGQRAADGRH